MAVRLPNGLYRERGFTLMEVLIAVTITAVIGLGVWQVINGVVRSRDRVDEVADQFDGLQRAMLLLERDITQIVNRSARDVYGDYQPALTTRQEGFALVLTRQGWRNPWVRVAAGFSALPGSLPGVNCTGDTGPMWIRGRKTTALICCYWIMLPIWRCVSWMRIGHGRTSGPRIR